MGDSETIHDTARQVGFIKRNLDALSRKVGDRPQKDPAAKLRSAVVRAIVADLVSLNNPALSIETARARFKASAGVGQALRSKTFTRAVTNPASTGNEEWAANLSGTGTGPFAAASPSSIYSQLASRPSVLTLVGTTGPVILPAIVLDPDSTTASWVAEGQAIPVIQSAIGGDVLTGSKLGAISTHSREINRLTDGQIETVVETAIDTSIAKLIDKTMFSTDAAAPPIPAGLLNGVTPVTASTDPGAAGIAADVSALLAAVSPAIDPVFISTPEVRARAGILAPSTATAAWLTSPYIDPPNRLVCLDAGKIGLLEDGFQSDVSEQAVLHMSDAPLPLATGASGASAATAAPTTSLFQTALIGVRVLSDAAWGTRGANAVAFVDVAW